MHTGPPLSFPLPSHPGPVHRLLSIYTPYIVPETKEIVLFYMVTGTIQRVYIERLLFFFFPESQFFKEGGRLEFDFSGKSGVDG